MSDKDLAAQQEARDAVEAAYAAFTLLSRFDQDRIDTICDAMAKAALADAFLDWGKWPTTRRVSASLKINAKRTALPPRMSGTTSRD
ncbi:MAG: hypothetical protein M9893_11775 [Pyrinomonadaceae bacterium]|nr:hypothetical protein [Pyrinomonadaceae bacterium]